MSACRRAPQLPALRAGGSNTQGTLLRELFAQFGARSRLPSPAGGFAARVREFQGILGIRRLKGLDARRPSGVEDFVSRLLHLHHRHRRRGEPEHDSSTGTLIRSSVKRNRSPNRPRPPRSNARSCPAATANSTRERGAVALGKGVDHRRAVLRTPQNARNPPESPIFPTGTPAARGSRRSPEPRLQPCPIPANRSTPSFRQTRTASLGAVCRSSACARACAAPVAPSPRCGGPARTAAARTRSRSSARCCSAAPHVSGWAPVPEPPPARPGQ